MDQRLLPVMTRERGCVCSSSIDENPLPFRRPSVFQCDLGRSAVVVKECSPKQKLHPQVHVWLTRDEVHPGRLVDAVVCHAACWCEWHSSCPARLCAGPTTPQRLRHANTLITPTYLPPTFQFKLGGELSCISLRGC